MYWMIWPKIDKICVVEGQGSNDDDDDDDILFTHVFKLLKLINFH